MSASLRLPVDPVEARIVSAAESDLAALQQYASAKRTPRSETTVAPRHVVIAAAIVLPTLREAMECRRDVASALEAHAFELVPATPAYWDEP